MAIKLGALWAKDTKVGTILTGTITINGVEKKIVCFENTNKTKETSPDWNIQESETMNYNNNPRTVVNPRARVKKFEESTEIDDSDEIPF